MTTQNEAYFYAVGASLCFSTASLLFASYSKKISALWMNFFKTSVCFLCLSANIIFLKWVDVSISTFLALFLSGILGLGIADLFLLNAFTRMGPGRTLILFGFQPLILGISSWYLFQQEVSFYKFTAVFFFLICLFLFSLEKFKEQGHWEIVGLVAALLGVFFDNGGILLTRWAFNSAPEINVIEANFIRSMGGVCFYLVLHPFARADLIRNFRLLEKKQKLWITLASIAGCYVSLLLYLTAIRKAHLASLAAIGVLGPLYTTGLENFIYKKKWSKYLILSVVSFVIGFTILVAT